jgi:hypothetical protein
MSESSSLYRHCYFQALLIRDCLDCSWLIYQNFGATIVQGVVAFYRLARRKYKQVWLHFPSHLRFPLYLVTQRTIDESLLQLNSRTYTYWQTVSQCGNHLSILMQDRGDLDNY